jgi:hypothetical protein
MNILMEYFFFKKKGVEGKDPIEQKAKYTSFMKEAIKYNLPNGKKRSKSKRRILSQ